MKDYKVLGIDPGIDRCGFAILEFKNGKISIIDSGYVTTDRRAGNDDRLLQLYNDLKSIFDEDRMDLVVLEQLFFSVNKKTALVISEVRGVIKLLIRQMKVRLIEIHPLTLKKEIVGYGNANKKQIEYMIQQFFEMDEFNQIDDVADAIALAFVGIKKYLWNFDKGVG